MLLSCWFGSHGLCVTPSGVTTTEAEEAVASYCNATIFACENLCVFAKIRLIQVLYDLIFAKLLLTDLLSGHCTHFSNYPT